ncbi:MAG: hypothetical protein ACYCZM_15090, partial [Acidimicrobiales bacterium]
MAIHGHHVVDGERRGGGPHVFGVFAATGRCRKSGVISDAAQELRPWRVVCHSSSQPPQTRSMNPTHAARSTHAVRFFALLGLALLLGALPRPDYARQLTDADYARAAKFLLRSTDP